MIVKLKTIAKANYLKGKKLQLKDLPRIPNGKRSITNIGKPTTNTK
jgi:hypothetical protein